VNFHKSSFQKAILAKLKPGENEKQKKIENLKKIRKNLTENTCKIMTNLLGESVQISDNGDDNSVGAWRAMPL
jgi:flagellar motor switch protein FliM